MHANGIYTESGRVAFNYEALENKPVPDATLTQRGAFADAKAVGDRLAQVLSLPEGSTLSDAEVADIRAGANGTIYPTAGEAVRQQVSDTQAMALLFYIADDDSGTDYACKLHIRNGRPVLVYEIL